MKIRTPLLAATLAFAVSTAFAQAGGNNAQTMGAGAAPATGGGASAAPAQRGTPSGAVLFDDRNTPGWGQMSAQERETHRQRVGSMKSYNECQTFMSQHSERMKGRLTVDKAASTGAPGDGAVAANDPCGHLPRG